MPPDADEPNPDRPDAQLSGEPTVLERVRALNGVTWEWVDEAHRADGRRRYMGVIAQDVQAVFPEAVATTEGGLMVDYTGLVGALVEAVKELADRLERLEGTPTT